MPPRWLSSTPAQAHVSHVAHRGGAGCADGRDPIGQLGSFGAVWALLVPFPGGRGLGRVRWQQQPWRSVAPGPQLAAGALAKEGSGRSSVCWPAEVNLHGTKRLQSRGHVPGGRSGWPEGQGVHPAMQGPGGPAGRERRLPRAASR